MVILTTLDFVTETFVNLVYWNDGFAVEGKEIEDKFNRPKCCIIQVIMDQGFEVIHAIGTFVGISNN